MPDLLINHTNHPYSKWKSEQIVHTSQSYRKVIDVPFPQIDPTLTLSAVKVQAESILNEIRSITKSFDILIAGESTYVYNFVKAASALKITCICATTNRFIIENDNGTQTKTFIFIAYRKYTNVS